MAETKTWKLWEDDKINEKESTLLRRKADEVPIPLDSASTRDVTTLIESFKARDDALGLAAPQIGISKQIVVFKNKNFDKQAPVTSEKDFDVLINPRITQTRGDRETMREGCLSCPDLSVEIVRYSEIKVRAYDKNGNKMSKRYTGFLARIVQHELDHLDGKLIIDHGGSVYVPKEKQKFFNNLFQD